MDNLDYLAQIAAQTAPPQKKPVFSPFLIKILIGLTAALALVLILGIIVNSVNGKTTTLYQSFYLRIQGLSSESGSIATYARDVHSSELRALASTLKSTLSATTQNFTGILAELNISTTDIHPDVVAAEVGHLTNYITTLQDAKLNGILDRTFANSTTLQISLLLVQLSDMLQRNPSDSARIVIDQTKTNLELLHARFVQFNNSSS